MRTSSGPKVAQVIGTFGGGGAERQAWNLVAGVADQGLNSCGIALRNRGDFAEGGAAEVHELHAHQGGRSGALKAMARLRRLVRTRGIEVLHVHGSRCVVFVAAATVAMSRPPRLVFTWQDSGDVLERTRGFGRTSTVWAVRRCRAVFGSSRDVAARLARSASIERVGVFHGGVPLREETSPPADVPPTILWMGRLVAGKDPAAMLRAAASLKAKGGRFRMVLTGGANRGSTYREEMERLASELGVGDVVEFAGYVNDRRIDELLGSSAIAVQSSASEGLSMALLEQMMAGLAIVATDVGDTGCAVRDGESGLLVPPRDDAALTGAIERLLADAELRRRLGAAARSRAIAEFSLAAMSSRAAGVYRSLVPEKASQRVARATQGVPVLPGKSHP